MTLYASFRQKIRPFLHSSRFSALIFLAAACVVAAQAPIVGTAVFALLIAAVLVLSENTALTLLPFSLLCMFVLKEYDSFDRFIKLWWLAIPVIPAILFHLIAFREKPKKGILFYGIIAVAVSVTLGGLSSISAAEYFTAANLYYVAGLGIAMVLMHLLISSKYHDFEGFSIQDHICRVFYLIGLFGVFMLAHHICIHWTEISQTHQLPYIQWSNNLSTFLMISLPFSFYYTKRNALHAVSTLLIMAAMLLSGSRSPLIFGVAEYVLCVAVFCVIDRKKWYVYAVPLLLCAVVVFIYRTAIFARISELLHLQNGIENEARYKMALRAWGEFCANPLFGSGLGATGRQDIYNPVKFAMNWYHSAPFQIFGSLGILGIAAYVFQWFTRLKTFCLRRTVFGWTVLLSQGGLFLMSLVNPGFFCPFPYEFFMVILFAVLADYNGKAKETA